MCFAETPYAAFMVKSSAQRQSAFDSRQTEQGCRRLNTFISGTAHKAIARIADREGVTHREAIERLALAADARQIMQEEI